MSGLKTFETELRALEEEELEEHRKIREKFYEKQRKVLARRDEEIEQIPNFWVETLQNCPLISCVITDENLEILDYISAINVVKEPERISIIFKFEDNPYFDNKQLRKDFIVDQTEAFSGVKASKINWKKDPEKSQSSQNTESEGFFEWLQDEHTINDIMAKALIYEIYPFPAKYYLEDEEIEAHTNSTELPDINEE